MNSGFLFKKIKINDFNLINNIFKCEPYPIYEQNWQHIFSYIKFESNIYILKKNDFTSVCFKKNKKYVMFSPYFTNIESLKSAIIFIKNKNNENVVKIINISEFWLNKFKNISYGINYKIINRSEREALYDVDLLCKLEGRDFEKLRQIKNKNIIGKKIYFNDLNNKGISDCVHIIKKWNNVQGFKYKKK